MSKKKKKLINRFPLNRKSRFPLNARRVAPLGINRFILESKIVDRQQLYWLRAVVDLNRAANARLHYFYYKRKRTIVFKSVQRVLASRPDGSTMDLNRTSWAHYTLYTGPLCILYMYAVHETLAHPRPTPLSYNFFLLLIFLPVFPILSLETIYIYIIHVYSAPIPLHPALAHTYAVYTYTLYYTCVCAAGRACF